MRVLVTGGAGFIGSNLIRSLIGSGANVRALDNLSTGTRENLLGVEGLEEFIVSDICDPGAVFRAASGTDIIYHLAALPSVGRSVADPIRSHRTNVDGTLNVLEAARLGGVRRVVYASSSSVYGDTRVLPKHEDLPVSPLSPYAASKLSGEAYCRAYARSFEMETVCLRFFNVFGPRQDPASEYAAVIPRFARAMMAGNRPVVFGDGQQTRDFTYVANVVQACLLGGETRTGVGEAINIGSGGRFSLIQLVDALNELLGTSLEPIFGPPREGDVRDSMADVSKAATLLGYQPLVTFRDGLRQTVQWLERHAYLSAAPAAAAATRGGEPVRGRSGVV